MKLHPHHTLYINSMRKYLKVTAIFPDTDEGAAAANKHMAKSDNDDAAVAVFAGNIFLANVYDKGAKIA